MKKTLTFFLLLGTLQLIAQNYPVTNITISLPGNPDANTANWASGTAMFSISASARTVNGRIDDRMMQSRILVQVKKSGGKVCGNYTANSSPVAGFNVPSKVWSGNSAVSLLGTSCTLTPGDYELCVQFFGDGPAGNIALSDEKCKPFTILGEEQKNYQAPQLVMPSNESAFTEADIKKPINFRWTPVVPKPQEPVTYRLNVWQLMEGQNATQAISTNQPIFTKDVNNITQFTATNIITGPCKPPYLCDFVWNVQALNRDGKPIGSNNGISNIHSFSYAINHSGCPRKNVSWNAIENELNRVANCAIPFGGCATYNEITTTEPQLIWSGSFNHNFTVAEQNNLIAQAKQWAQNNKPSGCNNSQKSVVSISYITQMAVPGNDDNYCLIYIVVQYGCCTSMVDFTKPTVRISLSSPGNTSTLRSAKNLLFTWSPSETTPPGSSYKIKIVEITGDQSPEQALRTNKPHFEKDSIPMPWLKLPDDVSAFKAGSKYAWQVQLLNREGKPIGTNNGTSEAYMFSMATANCVMSTTLIDAVCIGSTATTKTIRVKIKIVNNSAVATPATIYMNHANTFTHPLYASLSLNASNLVQAKNQSFVVSPGVNSVVASVPLFYPTTIAQGGSVIQEVDVNINNATTSFNLLVLTTSKGNAAGDALVPCYEDVLVSNIPPCPCTYCTDNMIVLNGASPISISGNTLTITNNISIPGISVKQFKAELIGFSYAPSNNNQQCWVCNKDDNQWGNFTSGTFSSPFPSMVNGVFPSLPCCGGNSHHTIGWWGASTTIMNKPLQLKISLPPASTLSCCPYKISFCIRYTFTDSECRSCSMIRCFDYIRQPQGGSIPVEEIEDVSETDNKN